MPVYVNVVCDMRGCDSMERVGFEGLSESFGDLVSEMEAEGWSIEIESLGETSVTCPNHDDGLEEVPEPPAQENPCCVEVNAGGYEDIAQDIERRNAEWLSAPMWKRLWWNLTRTGPWDR